MSGSFVRSFHWGRHLIALVVLAILDVHQRLRRRIGRNFLRVALGLLSVTLTVIVFSSLLALIQITRSVQSLIGDSMVGLEASVDMRAAVRETQTDLLRLRVDPERKLSADEIDAFRKRMDQLMTNYRTGAFEEADRRNARAIESAMDVYVAALLKLSDSPAVDTQAIQAADDLARQLLADVMTAYQFNRTRVHASADEASNAAGQALRIAKRLGWSFAIFFLGVLLTYFAYRWLALPEEMDA